MSRLKDQHNDIYEAWVAKQALAAIIPNPTVYVFNVPKADRYKSTWERQYGQHLEARVRAHDIRQYEYEALRFRLADGTMYTPDFVLWLPDDVVEVHEIKGRQREAAMVRFKVARDRYPRFIWRMLKKSCGRWVELDV
jgi:hypothetical protein